MITISITSFMTQFTRELVKLLEQKRMSHLEFAEKIGYVGNSRVSQVITGRRPMPLNDLTRWLDKLELNDEQWNKMFRLALQGYAPKPFLIMLEKLDVYKSFLNRLSRNLREMGVEFDQPFPSESLKRR